MIRKILSSLVHHHTFSTRFVLNGIATSTPNAPVHLLCGLVWLWRRIVRSFSSSEVGAFMRERYGHLTPEARRTQSNQSCALVLATDTVCKSPRSRAKADSAIGNTIMAYRRLSLACWRQTPLLFPCDLHLSKCRHA